MKLCSIPNCKNKSYAKGLCFSHYMSIRNKVRKILKRESLGPRKCLICGEDITRDHLKAKFCEKHRGFTEPIIKRLLNNMKRSIEMSESRRKLIEKIQLKYNISTSNKIFQTPNDEQELYKFLVNRKKMDKEF